jgi:hypothetical protein
MVYLNFEDDRLQPIGPREFDLILRAHEERHRTPRADHRLGAPATRSSRRSASTSGASSRPPCSSTGIAAFIHPRNFTKDGASNRQAEYDPPDDRYSRVIVDELLPDDRPDERPVR